jgi:Na+-driven multidrug efflux pump
MGWPVILVFGWLGAHFGGAAGAIIGTFLGIFAYFWGIFKALPKYDDPPKDKNKDRKPPDEDRQE